MSRLEELVFGKWFKRDAQGNPIETGRGAKAPVVVVAPVVPPAPAVPATPAPAPAAPIPVVPVPAPAPALAVVAPSVVDLHVGTAAETPPPPTADPPVKSVMQHIEDELAALVKKL